MGPKLLFLPWLGIGSEFGPRALCVHSEVEPLKNTKSLSFLSDVHSATELEMFFKSQRIVENSPEFARISEDQAEPTDGTQSIPSYLLPSRKCTSTSSRNQPPSFIFSTDSVRTGLGLRGHSRDLAAHSSFKKPIREVENTNS